MDETENIPTEVQMPTTSQPRKSGTTPANKPTLDIGLPTKADGTAHTQLVAQIGARFESVKLYADQERKKLLATIVAPEKEDVSNVGVQLQSYICAVVEAAYAGTGFGPDGSAVFVRDKFAAVNASTKIDLRTVWLEAIPKSGSRASLNGYLAKVGSLQTMLAIRADTVQLSQKVYGTQTQRVRKSRSKKAEEVTVFL